MKLFGKFGQRRPEPLNPDTAAIRALAGLLAETGLSEIEYSIGDHRIRVAREIANGKAAPPVNGQASAAAAPVGGPGLAVAAPAPAVDAAAAAGVPPRPTVEAPGTDNGAEHPGTLSSPMVGVAYLAPEPGAAPFARVGDQVAKGQPLLIIEAMKVMNQIRAPHAGRLARVFIEDGTPVEYGAPLMLIE